VPDVTAAIAVDGRRQRSADSRQRILAAMRALIQEGKPDPAAEDVAQRAGVGLRTVFRLFRDMESVCAEMLIPQRQVFFACFTSPFTQPAGRARLHDLFDRLEMLTFLMSYDSWMRLRDQQALGPNETKALLDQAINAALA
jgi:AcrR family transcriptional regulator